MQVLSVASEMFPFIKTGGLADVSGALPRALGSHGIAVRTMLPCYPAVKRRLPAEAAVVHRYDTLFGGQASIIAAQLDGHDLLVFDAPHLFDRPGGAYGDGTGSDWADNWLRFAAFSRAAADVALGAAGDWTADLVQAHDWQAAMTLAYLRYDQRPAPPSVMTVHNLAFQGRYPASIFPQLGLPAQAMSIDGVEYFGGVGYLKAGLQAASAITSVSPTYVQEIRTPEFGMGLEGLINGRGDDLYGILNGIDTKEWDPETDPHLAARYSAKTLARRAENRRAIRERFQLDDDASPIICVISRLTWQKGMDILAAEVGRIVGLGAKLAILGSGDAALEGAFIAAASRHAGRVGVVTGYDEALAHLLQGGADAILIPSRFEPCGLTQLYGLRYGCIPAVARTGGLADTIIDANHAALAAGVATGFQFAPGSGDAMVEGLHRLMTVFRHRKAWSALQRQAMKTDVSWDASAAEYAKLFRALASKE
ncbi:MULTISPECIES: glycogen synthase GlgA [unclassified Aminobacter]|uniref:glycogen synthase GlgA n=1 Tax=unclassified Aminobacter TaxID=2644704 RepID=UPI0004670510|nr:MULTISPECIES: glycogen synthase GlgA [unclassified Aminobacter]TWH28392.1 starch synthase [Aminobacter sp. J15]